MKFIEYLGRDFFQDDVSGLPSNFTFNIKQFKEN